MIIRDLRQGQRFYFMGPTKAMGQFIVSIIRDGEQAAIGLTGRYAGIFCPINHGRENEPIRLAGKQKGIKS